MMQIILNVDVLLPPLTGIGRYVYELAYGLKTYPELAVNYTALGKIIDDPGYYLNSAHPVNYIRRHVPLRTLARKIYYEFKDYRLSQQLKTFSNCLYHGPNYTLPRRFNGPCVSTIHDLTHVRYPNFHLRERVNYLNKQLPKTIMQSTQIITVSNFIRQELIELLNIEPTKIKTVYLGVDPNYHPRAAVDLAPVLAKYNLQAKAYILAVATLEPRKNLFNLIQAYQALDYSIKQQFPLVLVGANGWLNRDLLKLTRPLEAKGQLYRLGYVPEYVLTSLYAAAKIFVFPSFYEGFGLPVLEAMASGIPVLTSKNSAMAEVTQDAAILIEPLDVNAISTGIIQLLSDEKNNQRLIKKGLQRAAEFSWNKCVAETVNIYQNLINTAENGGV